MRLTMAFLWTHFHELFKHYATRNTLPGVDPEDTVQNLLILSSLHEWQPQKTKCRHSGLWLPIDPSHIHRFVRSRALDLLRNEATYRKHLNQFPVPETPMEVSLTEGYEVVGHVLAVLRGRGLTDTECRIVVEKAFPSSDTLLLSIREARGKQKPPQILTRHVAKTCGVSKATASRAFTKAQRLLKETPGCLDILA